MMLEQLSVYHVESFRAGGGGVSSLEPKVAQFIDQLRELAGSNLVSTSAVTPGSIQLAGQYLEAYGADIVHLKCHHVHSSQQALGYGISTPIWSLVTSCVPDPNAQHLVAIFAIFLHIKFN